MDGVFFQIFSVHIRHFDASKDDDEWPFCSGCFGTHGTHRLVTVIADSRFLVHLSQLSLHAIDALIVLKAINNTIECMCAKITKLYI